MSEELRVLLKRRLIYVRTAINNSQKRCFTDGFLEM